MSVDYSANFGIGMQVETPTDEEIKKLNIGCDDWWDYFNKILKDTDFDYFQYGSAYIDEELKMCVIFKDKYNSTLDLRPLKSKLDSFIKKTILKPIGNFGIVGGLEES